MVIIEDLEELRKIKHSNYGFVIIETESSKIIHTTSCKLIFEKEFLEKKMEFPKYHWYSTYSLAEKKLGSMKLCKLCNP